MSRIGNMAAGVADRQLIAAHSWANLPMSRPPVRLTLALLFFLSIHRRKSRQLHHGHAIDEEGIHDPVNVRSSRAAPPERGSPAAGRSNRVSKP
jgi:hypothetical protein